MIPERYRKDYEGEFVITESKWSGGKKTQNREWVANPIQNQHLSKRAACILSNIDRELFNHTILQKHRGGLLGSKKLQTYGVGSISKEMRLDFTVETAPEKLKDIIARGYQEQNIVYTTARQCLIHPGEFYLIPYNIIIALEALPLYLAAFDGHQEIFLLGYTNDTPAGNTAWKEHVGNVISAYRSTKFVGVGQPHNLPAQWKEFANYRTITHREFISYCDV